MPRVRLPNRDCGRNVGELDSRLQSDITLQTPAAMPDIPLMVTGYPIVWIDPDSMSMTAGTEQPTFTDRAGQSWAKTVFTGSTSLWQIPNGMNGRNCLRSCGINDADLGSGVGASSMVTNITIGPNFTVIFAIRLNSRVPSNQDATAAIFMRHQVSVGNDANNFFCFTTASAGTSLFSFDRVDTGQVNSAAATGPGVTHVVTYQSTQARNEVWLDGVVGGNADPANTAFTNPNNLYIGCGYPTTPQAYYTLCDFGDILIYNSILSSADRIAVEKYLGRKYGVSVVG